MEVADEVAMQAIISIHSVPRPSTPPQPHRLHGLDTLRGIASVLVVLLHAGIPYMVHPMPFLLWPARDLHPSRIVDGLTWWIECFIMPLFFVLAGFFSNGVLASQGERKFLAGRTRRLLSTQFVAMLTILPMCLAVWSIGLMADGVYAPTGISNFRLSRDLERDLFGVAHLWFLQNLYVYCLVLCGATWLGRRITQATSGQQAKGLGLLRSLEGLGRSAWKPIFPAIPCAIILYCDPRIVLGFYQSFVPVGSKLFYYGIYFFVGAILNAHPDKFTIHRRYGKRYLAIASILFASILPQIHEQTTTGLSGLRLALLTGSIALFASFTTFGLIAVFVKSERRDNVVTRYLADASFWVYLIHLPCVTLTHVAIAWMPVATELKFLLAAATALALSLMSYHVLVRGKWIGEFLKGCPRRIEPRTEIPEPVIARLPAALPYFAELEGEALKKSA
jgi:glucan biosynthesis protein C